MRFFLAMLSHETNTFPSHPTDRGQFEAHDLRYGGEIARGVPRHRHLPGRHDRGRRARSARRWCPRWPPPPLRPAASPRLYERRQASACSPTSGPPAGSTACCSICTAPWCRRASTTARATSSRPCARWSAPRADRGHPRLPRQPRRATWSRTPTCCTATRPTRTWTWPSAAWRRPSGSLEVIAGRIRPTAAWRKPPILPPLGSQGTARGPMRRLYDLADAMEKRPEGHRRSRSSPDSRSRTSPTRGSASTWSPTTTRRSPSALADELGEGGVGARREFLHTALPVRTRWRGRSPLDGRPVVLADMADNTGGGAAATPPRSCVSCCGWAPAGPRWRACGTRRRCGLRRPPGVGARVTLDVGGKVDTATARRSA